MFFSILALAIIGLPLLYHRYSSPLSPAVLGGCAVAALAVWALGMSLNVGGSKAAVKYLTGPEEALGYMMAKQIVADGVPPGKVDVRNPVPRGDRWKARVEARLKGVRKALEGTSYSIDDAVEGQSVDETKSEISGVAGASEGVATISFVGPPRKYKKSKHPFYVYVKTEHDPNLWYAALKRGQLNAVFRDLPPGKRSKPARNSPAAVFDSRYQMIPKDDVPPKIELFPRPKAM